MFAVQWALAHATLAGSTITPSSSRPLIGFSLRQKRPMPRPGQGNPACGFFQPRRKGAPSEGDRPGALQGLGYLKRIYLASSAIPASHWFRSRNRRSPGSVARGFSMWATLKADRSQRSFCFDYIEKPRLGVNLGLSRSTFVHLRRVSADPDSGKSVAFPE
jgi:hypothetical protein